MPVEPWRDGKRRVLCGQHGTYSPQWAAPHDWYRTVRGATHFRKHPHGDNPTGLPELRTWSDVGQAITLNSSVAVDAVLAGIPTTTMDEGAYGVGRHQPPPGGDRETSARLPWLH